MDHDPKKLEALGEFEIIRRYFSHTGVPMPSEVLLGVGDDAAIVSCAPEALVLTVDTLVSGVHFYPDDPPSSVAHKALMVNLSDLSAMGATPFAFLLALTLPTVDEPWLKAFSDTLRTQALQHQVTLVGGDTTRGPLSISITALGRIMPSHALKRSAAKIGDDIYVTGELGLAAFYVYARSRGIDAGERAKRAYQYPEPPVSLGPKLCGLAHAAIDVSDGLLADLSHILTESQVGARVVRECVPLAKEWQAISPEEAFQAAVTGGDDYVLCFTAPKSAATLLTRLAETMGMTFSVIGEVCEGSALLLDGKPWSSSLGFEHFKGA